jgi:hypothetical protein
MNNPNWSRRQTVDEIKETLLFGDLSDSYGINESKEVDKKGKSHYSVTFCKARVLDGVVKIYSNKFILVSWMTGYRDMPHKGQEVFRSCADAKRFIQKSFVR